MAEQGSKAEERRGEVSPAVSLVRQVRVRARRALLAGAWARAAALTIGAVFAIGVADFALRFPPGVRLVLLAALLYGIFEVFRRLVLPAWRFRPSLADVALRLERAGAGPGVLASGVDLATNRREDAGALTRGLAEQARAEADTAASGAGRAAHVRGSDLWRGVVVLLAAAVIAGVPAVVRPDLAAIGLSRTLLPFGGAEWPRRTALVDATLVAVHPIGEALPLRAVVTKTNRGPGQTDVAAEYRVLADGVDDGVRRVKLTSQSRSASVRNSEGELFERLLDADFGEASEAEIEYTLVTEDDRTEPRRIRLVERPRVNAVRVGVRPPAYVRGVVHAYLSGEGIDIRPDGDGVAAIGPVLAGSEIEVELAFNKPARVRDPGAGWASSGSSGVRWSGRVVEPMRLSVILEDELGLQSGGTLVVQTDVAEDLPASATVTEPAFDESVLATAAIRAVGEGHDELGMASVRLERQVLSPPAGSQGAPPEPVGDPVAAARVAATKPATDLRAEAVLDLATLGVRVGDEVHLTAVALDIFASGRADDREVRSGVRRLRVIDEASLIEQIQGELSGVRRSAIEIDRAQRDLTEAAAEAETVERQSSVTQRTSAQREVLERVGGRVSRNGLADPTLEGMIADAGAALESAARASARAAQELDRATREGLEADEGARTEQARVREELERVISMLDEGQDNWVARRTVESLLGDQRSLMEESEDFAERTRGRPVEELSRDERSELERIAARQREAAERARQAMDTLADRAELLRGVDPGQSQAMSNAASRGREERVAENMERAAERLGENQAGGAAQDQQEAVESLEEMLEDIDAADANRDEALRRVLAGVSASLQALIAAQEQEISRLNAGREAGAALAGGMVGLATNTLGLLDEIGPQRELATIAGLVEEAASAQESAVVALRGDDREGAGESENESLAKLREAKAEADKMDEEAASRESSRKRAELRAAYRALLEQQVAVTADTGAFVGVKLDRRSRASVRALGQREDAVRAALTELREGVEEIASTTVFDLAHNRLDSAAGGAAETLLSGVADGGVQRRQRTVERVLQSLIEAMAEQSGDQQFGQQESSSGGGGSGGSQEAPVIPELAELKLLRSMQQEVADWTRNIDESGARPSGEELEDISSLQRDLAERGQVLIDKLTGQAEGGDAGQMEVEE